ncbi:MAG: nucleotidyltransferase domain-containing protein [Pseudomonadota bacterium]|nr:nucleotidyltransferase domain-containing protein [Gammaproteobacteria bacterium]MDQ3582438.1 nucleotidyltransferase domain-containing protein [Pseudomonadota bacterium]
MRLSEEERSVIREAVGEAFEGRARVWLFGSRVDDALRGGDIDLYIETDLPFERSFPARTQLGLLLAERLGEQKIDIVVRHGDMGGDRAPIYGVARETGVLL